MHRVYPRPGGPGARQAGAEVTDPAPVDDMRRQIVLRELGQGALAGLRSEISEQAADLVLAALDRYDSWATAQTAGPSDRLARIAEAHRKNQTSGGMTDGYCDECAHAWPCPTWSWAATQRDPLATWDPVDDEDDMGVTS